MLAIWVGLDFHLYTLQLVRLHIITTTNQLLRTGKEY